MVKIENPKPDWTLVEIFFKSNELSLLNCDDIELFYILENISIFGDLEFFYAKVAHMLVLLLKILRFQLFQINV